VARPAGPIVDLASVSNQYLMSGKMIRVLDDVRVEVRANELVVYLDRRALVRRRY